MQIVKAEPQHLAAIAAAERAVFSDAWSESSLSSHLAAASAVTFAAMEGNALCGYLLGSVIAPEGEVYRIAVLPPWRRRGVGEALLAELLALCEVCFLEVRKSNTGARAFYEKNGFSLIAERRNYYKAPTEDACIYRYGAQTL